MLSNGQVFKVRDQVFLFLFLFLSFFFLFGDRYSMEEYSSGFLMKIMLSGMPLSLQHELYLKCVRLFCINVGEGADRSGKH